MANVAHLHGDILSVFRHWKSNQFSGLSGELGVASRIAVSGKRITLED